MRVNEIFYSIQGEGYHSGRAAVFIRLSGCNLKCPFCDTDFSASEEMEVGEIVNEVVNYSSDCHFVVLTGGEPTLQDCMPLIEALHAKRYKVAMETNGTNQVPFNIDWVTISPKFPFVGNHAAAIKQQTCDELKCVYDGTYNPNDVLKHFSNAVHLYVQPCDTGFLKPNQENIQKCVEFIKENPIWKLSIQTQKILKVR